MHELEETSAAHFYTRYKASYRMPWNLYVIRAGLELLIFPSLLPECWDGAQWGPLNSGPRAS